MDPSFVAPFLDWGVPGAIIIVLGWALWQRQQKYDEIQEKRITETREVIDAVNRNTVAMETLSDVVRVAIGAGK